MGYGFVKFADAASATQAVQHMNGYRLEGKVLAVRVAGKPPPPGGAGIVPNAPQPTGFPQQQQAQKQQPPGPPWQFYGSTSSLEYTTNASLQPVWSSRGLSRRSSCRKSHASWSFLGPQGHFHHSEVRIQVLQGKDRHHLHHLV